MAIVRLAVASVLARRTTAGLTILAIALSTALLLGVEKLRNDAREAFANTISGTDLVVGARSGTVQLLLYSVFRIGNATSNVSWASYREIAAHPKVAWTVPISLGDSHRGFRVMGTTREYFERYRHGRRQPLEFAEGAPFADVYDAVLGIEVAERLGYRVGDPIVVAHGAGAINLVEHDDKPFRVTGILERTGTPVDRTVHVSLQGIEAIHADWKGGVRAPGFRLGADAAREVTLEPSTITAFLVGLDSRIAVFSVQRRINEFRAEPLLAIIPGVALQQLWDLMGVAETALRLISLMVVVTGILGMLTVILSTLEARRREMAVLRSVGARPGHIFALFMSEACVLALIGVACGLVGLYLAVLVGRPFAARELGLDLPLSPPAPRDLAILGGIVSAACLVAVAPAIRAYRLSLADGLSPRL